MKETELMFYDWVQYRGMIGFVTLFFDRDRVELTVPVEEGCDFRIVCVSDLEPIPITDEILKKNGFIGDTRSCYSFSMPGIYFISMKLEVGEIEIYDEKGHSASGYVCRSVNVPSLKFVHELQLSLRLCGLAEQANNFKIITQNQQQYEH